MKKLILSLALLGGTAVAAQAQVTYGIKAGATLTNVTGDNTSSLKNQFGFAGGLFANFKVNDVFSVQPEVLYSMKGAKNEANQSINGYTATGTEHARLNYIDVPVLAHINAGGLFFEAGPQVGFLVSAHDKGDYTVSGGGTSQSGSFNDDIKDQFTSVAFGYAAGLGYQMPDGGPGIGLRYNGDFTNINKDDSSKNHNSVFMLYLSYSFGGK